MDFASRHRTGTDAPKTKSPHRCPQCQLEALVLSRRHVSPPSLGAPVVTEYYQCDYCDARFQYSPETNRWKPVS